MTTEIYTEQSGAQSTQLFGCTVKSINAQMGFDDQPTVVTVTVIKDTNQSFTLDKNDVQSIQPIQFGSLNISGIVQSWDNVVTNVGGTGIYTIKLTDCRTVLDSAVVITNPATHWQETDFGVDQLPSGTDDAVMDYGENVIPIPIPTEHDFDFGLPFSNVKNSLHGAVLYYGNNVFEIDVDALEILPYNNTGRGAPVRLDGPVKSVSEVISEICKQFGYQWWVECHRKSATDSTIVIEVNIISRLGEANNSIVFDMDSLAALHPNKVNSRKDGHENKNEITKTILQGGIRRQLLEITSSHTRPFWGWNEDGTIPIDGPAYQDPAYNTYRLKSTSVLQMKQALNGDLDDTWTGNRENDLVALKGYANQHWGKTFYLRLHSRYLDTDGRSWVKSVPAGWWEGNLTPAELTDIALYILCSDDGRWKPFVKFPFARKWDDSVLASNNVVRHKGHLYVLGSLKQTGKYVVIDLSVPTKFITSIQNAPKRINHSTSLEGAWIPFMDSREFYGPWSSDTQTPPRFQKRGKTVIEIDSDLVPWKHGYRGMSNAQGMNELNWIAEGRIHARTIERQIINTGQLEVADVPRVNIGRAIDGGSNITNISTQFSNTGITTRYTMNLYTDELGNLRQIERKRADEFYRLLRKMQTKTAYKKDTAINDELKTLFDKYGGPVDVTTDFVMEGIEGGMGIITTVGPGPYYGVRRISYQDIDPLSYAGTSVLADSYFQSEWTQVRNLSEPLNSPGMLPVGTQVTVSIFSESDEHGPYLPYMEQAPQFFAPPPLE